MKKHKFSYLLSLLFLCSNLFVSSQNTKIDSLLNVLKTAKEDSIKVEILVRLCWHQSLLNLPTAQKYGEQAMQLAKKIGFTKGKADALLNLGHYKMRISANDTAIQLMNSALSIYKQLNHLDGIYKCYNNLGLLYRRKTMFPKSLACYLECLEIAEKEKDSIDIAGCYSSIGSIYSFQNKFEISRGYFNKGLKISEKLGKQSVQGNLYMNLGGDFFAQDKLDSAVLLFKNAMSIYELLDVKLEAAEALSNIGIVYAVQKNYPKALAFSLRGLKVLESIGEKNALGIQYNQVAEIYLMQKDASKAIIYFNKAMIIHKEIKDLYYLKTCYENLSHLYEQTNDLKKALHFYTLYSSLKDSIINKESSKQIAEVNTKYQTEKKDAQIKLLNKDKELQAEIALEESKKQKIILTSICTFLLMVIIFTFYIFRSFRQKQKANIIITLQKEEVEKAKKLIELQKDIVEEKQTEILDSIHYAQRIQHALLASETILNENLNGSDNHFVFFKPKDIVSGDFYWATSIISDSEFQVSDYAAINPKHETSNKELFYLAVCDSTGHGVPGAFMSLLNIGFLSEAIKEKRIFEPNKIFDYARKRLIESISSEGQKDGFDGILICINKTTKQITYAASNNSPLMISDSGLTYLPVDKMPVGQGEKTENFQANTINYKSGDTLFLFTDGIADQFGGPKGKKFKYKQLEEILLSNIHLSPEKQKLQLNQKFDAWKGDLEQVDDVLIIGIKL